MSCSNNPEWVRKIQEAEDKLEAAESLAKDLREKGWAAYVELNDDGFITFHCEKLLPKKRSWRKRFFKK